MDSVYGCKKNLEHIFLRKKKICAHYCSSLSVWTQGDLVSAAPGFNSVWWSQILWYFALDTCWGSTCGIIVGDICLRK